MCLKLFFARQYASEAPIPRAERQTISKNVRALADVCAWDPHN
jgi:hypothetical protein